jgi:ketosteroid isomerase-like protein
MSTSEQVQRYFTAWADAHARKDLAAVANSFTDRTLYVRPGDTTLKGSDELVEAFAGDTQTYRFEPGDELLEGDDLVVSVGKWFEIDESGTESGPKRYVAIFRRDAEGVLRIVVGVPLVD